AAARRATPGRADRSRFHAWAAPAYRTTRAGGLPALDPAAQPDGVEPVSRRDREIDGAADAVDHARCDRLAGGADRDCGVVAQSPPAGVARYRLVLRRAIAHGNHHSIGTGVRTADVLCVDRRIARGGSIAAWPPMENRAADPARLRC